MNLKNKSLNTTRLSFKCSPIKPGLFFKNVISSTLPRHCPRRRESSSSAQTAEEGQKTYVGPADGAVLAD